MVSAGRLPPLRDVLRLSLCLIGASLSLAPARPGSPPARIERRLEAMGTLLGLSVAGPDRAAAFEASETAVREISRVEALLTTWRPGGPLDSVNTAPPGRAVVLDAELSQVLETVFGWSERTDGAFDPTVLPLVRAWDLRGPGRIPDAAALSRALAATGRGRFSKALPDWGARGAAVGRASVAVADPRDRCRPAVTLSVEDESVSTSGNSERGRTVAGRRIGRLLAPRTGQPAPDFGSATAVAPSGLTADVLSTAFFVLGPEKGLELSERLRREGLRNEAVFLVVADGRLRVVASPGIHARIEEEGN